MAPQVSIGLPFYNPGIHFRLAIQSVFAQTFSNWELLLLNDGSTDGSLELARGLRDSRVRVFSDGLNKRLTARLNELVRLASTPYFFRMDADDVMHPRRLEMQYSLLAQSPENSVIGTGAYSIDHASNIIGFRPVQERPAGGSTAHFFTHPTVCGFTKWFAAHPYNDDFIYHLCEDAELWTRTADSAHFRNLPANLLFYREEGGFSLRKYLSAQPGLLYLLTRRFEKQKGWLLLRSAEKLLKIWWVIATASLGDTRRLVRRRYRPIGAEERKEAGAILNRIQAQEIPLG